MEYKKIGKQVFVRLDPGDELLSALEIVAKKENIQLATIAGLGAANRIVIGAYSLDEQKFHATELVGVYEILSVVGTIDQMEGMYYSHVHLVAAGEDGAAHGGHLKEATISATGELILTLVDGIVERKKDPKTGLNIWKL